MRRRGFLPDDPLRPRMPGIPMPAHLRLLMRLATEVTRHLRGSNEDRGRRRGKKREDDKEATR